MTQGIIIRAEQLAPQPGHGQVKAIVWMVDFQISNFLFKFATGWHTSPVPEVRIKSHMQLLATEAAGTPNPLICNLWTLISLEL